MQILSKIDQTSENWEIKAIFVILKTISVIPYPYNFSVSYPLSLKLFCQLSLIPKTPNRASILQESNKS